MRHLALSKALWEGVQDQSEDVRRAAAGQLGRVEACHTALQQITSIIFNLKIQEDRSRARQNIQTSCSWAPSTCTSSLFVPDFNSAGLALFANSDFHEAPLDMAAYSDVTSHCCKAAAIHRQTLASCLEGLGPTEFGTLTVSASSELDMLNFLHVCVQNSHVPLLSTTVGRKIWINF